MRIEKTAKGWLQANAIPFKSKHLKFLYFSCIWPDRNHGQIEMERPARDFRTGLSVEVLSFELSDFLQKRRLAMRMAAPTAVRASAAATCVTASSTAHVASTSAISSARVRAAARAASTVIATPSASITPRRATPTSAVTSWGAVVASTAVAAAWRGGVGS